jgi:uncharacterized protein (DUF305 family)
MTAMRRSLVLGSVVVLALGLTACTADEVPAPTSPVVQLGAPGEANRTLSPEEAAGLEMVEHVEADVTFMRGMIDHHSQALVMTGLVEERTDDRDIRLLAERMEISQQDEIDQMAKWLQDRAQPLREDGHAGHGDMPGMLTEGQLAELEAAKGDAFDRLFLEYMIQHHEGALQMVRDLYKAGGGQEATIGQFALHVEGDQGIEIARMQEMLAARSS